MCCMVIGKTFSFLYHIRGILNNAEMNAGVTQSKMMVSDKCKTTQNYPCNTIGQFQPSLPFHTHVGATVRPKIQVSCSSWAKDVLER